MIVAWSHMDFVTVLPWIPGTFRIDPAPHSEKRIPTTTLLYSEGNTRMPLVHDPNKGG
jgi:hypothetical protein